MLWVSNNIRLMKVGEIIILTFLGRKILIINFFNWGQRHQTTMCGSLGLSPRLGLLRSQARPKPTSSPCQGWALARLEWAQLSELRASSPAQHITIYATWFPSIIHSFYELGYPVHCNIHLATKCAATWETCYLATSDKCIVITK